jgi:hypothetical protein
MALLFVTNEVKGLAPLLFRGLLVSDFPWAEFGPKKTYPLNGTKAAILCSHARGFYCTGPEGIK